MTCKNCGNTLVDHARFCNICGAPVAVEPVVTDPTPKAPKTRKKAPKALWIILPIVLVLAIAGTAFGVFYNAKSNQYAEAESLWEDSKYEDALELYLDLGSFKDSEAKAAELEQLQEDYDAAITLMDSGSYEEAMDAFEALDDYRDSEALLEELEQLQEDYEDAVALLKDRQFSEAKAAFEKLDDYRDSEEQAKYNVTYEMAMYVLENAVEAPQEIVDLVAENTDINTSSTTDEWDLQYSIYLYTGAAALFEQLEGYQDSEDRCSECYYQLALLRLETREPVEAMACREYMNDAHQADFDTAYDSLYADRVFLVDLLQALRDRADYITNEMADDYRPVLAFEQEVLDRYNGYYFVDHDLEMQYQKLTAGLDYQWDALDSNGYLVDDNSFFMGTALRYEAISAIHEAYGLLDNDPDMQETFLGQAAYARFIATLNPIIENSLIGIAPKQDSSGNYYLPLKNDTDYSFTMYFEQEFHNGNSLYETSNSTVDIAANQTTNVPLYFPDNDAAWDTWYIWWEFDAFTDIELNGVSIW